MSVTLAKQFAGFARCCLELARSAKTATHRARFTQMAHEYWLASLRIREERVVPAVNGVGMVGHHQCEAGLPTEAIGDGSRSRPAPRRRFMRASSRRSSPASVFR